MRRKKQRPQYKNLAQVEGLDDHPVRSGRSVVAAHYDGDTSDYKMGHIHYQGKCRGPGSMAQNLESVTKVICIYTCCIAWILSSFIRMQTTRFSKRLGIFLKVRKKLLLSSVRIKIMLVMLLMTVIVKMSTDMGS
jgi:hypothetical protein